MITLILKLLPLLYFVSRIRKGDSIIKALFMTGLMEIGVWLLCVFII